MGASNTDAAFVHADIEDVRRSLSTLAGQFARLPKRERDLLQAYLAMGDGEHVAALLRLVELIPWSPRGPARTWISRRAREEERSWPEIRSDVLLTALCLAVGERLDARRWRIDREYLRDDAGHLMMVSIEDVLRVRDPALTWQWLVARTCREADLIAKEQDESSPHHADQLTELAWELSAEDECLAELSSEESSEALQQLFELASPRQRELIEVLLDQAVDGTVNVTQAASALGMTPNAALQSVDRLRRKVRQRAVDP